MNLHPCLLRAGGLYLLIVEYGALLAAIDGVCRQSGLCDRTGVRRTGALIFNWTYMRASPRLVRRLFLSARRLLTFVIELL